VSVSSLAEDTPAAESSAAIRARVPTARARATTRLARLGIAVNAHIPGRGGSPGLPDRRPRPPPARGGERPAGAPGARLHAHPPRGALDRRPRRRGRDHHRAPRRGDPVPEPRSTSQGVSPSGFNPSLLATPCRAPRLRLARRSATRRRATPAGRQARVWQSPPPTTLLRHGVALLSRPLGRGRRLALLGPRVPVAASQPLTEQNASAVRGRLQVDTLQTQYMEANGSSFLHVGLLRGRGLRRGSTLLPGRRVDRGASSLGWRRSGARRRDTEDPMTMPGWRCTPYAAADPLADAPGAILILFAGGRQGYVSDGERRPVLPAS